MFAVIIAWHDLSSSPDVMIRKRTRSMQIVEEGTEEGKGLMHSSKVHYDNWLRRYVLGHRPWIFSGLQEKLTGQSRRGE